MARTALTSPAHVVPQRNPGSFTGGSSVQPDSAPSLEYGGGGLLDARLPYNKYNSLGNGVAAQVLGWYGSGSILCVDQAPSAAATNNIAAAANLTASTAMTLVSSSGAGITVLSAAIVALPSLNTIPANTLAIDGAFGYVKFGIRDITGFYDPTKAVARVVSITSVSGANNNAAHNIVIKGYDLYGYPQTENIAPVSFATNPTTLGKKAWKYITSVTPDSGWADTSHNYSVGTSDVFGYPLRADTWGYVDPVWNNQAVIGGGAGTVNLLLPASPGGASANWATTLSVLANSQVIQFSPGFNGKLVGANYRVLAPATTASKHATLQLQVNGTSLTGGALDIGGSGTPAYSAAGTATAFSAISAGTQTFLSTGTVGFTVSSVTAFTEGSGTVELQLINTDTSGVNHTASDTTSPATASTGDVRGTFALPGATITSGGNGTLTAVSNGTAKLQIYINATLAGANNATSQSVGFFGVTPA